MGAGVGPLNIVVKNKTLEDVSTEITDQVGYRIVIDEKWKNIPVSGRFHNISAEDFFRRVLKGVNVILTIDTKRRIIVVQTAGKSLSKYIQRHENPEKVLAEDFEVTPGTKRSDVVEGPAYGSDVDPMDLEITPGIRRRDVVESSLTDSDTDPMQFDVTPGTKRIDVVEGPAYGPDVDPMDLEITPGIRRRDVVQGKVANFLHKKYGDRKRESSGKVHSQN
ncbi:hypothetical protein ACLG6S_01210 [Thermodesulfobacteriota bacterium B35]